MGQVSRVVYNRLAAGMHLDMTSTVLYSVGQDGGTGDPGRPQARHAVQHVPPRRPHPDADLPALAGGAGRRRLPPAGTWLYFVVVDKSGTEAFADTYTEQLANEELAQSRGVG